LVRQKGSGVIVTLDRAWLSKIGEARRSANGPWQKDIMAPPLLALRGVRLADGPRWLFDGVDLALGARERACLVGRNGAGKSTLLRILAGAQIPEEGERTLAAGTRISLVAQEPALSGVTLRDFATAGGAAAHEADAALEAFDLDPERRPEGLSGGEARRAALAKALAEQPDVLLLDEPTNHLDILAIERLEALIGRGRAAVLTVSHDRAFLERTTARCFWLEGARVRKLDAGFAAFETWAEAEAAAEAETARRLDKMLAREQHWLLRGVTARRARNEGRRRRLLSLRAAKSESLRLARGDLSLGAAEAAPSGKRVVEARKLAKAYGARTLIRDFSTRILRGDRVAIVGPNGAGKTTLVKLLLGEVAPDAGSVKLGTGLEVVYVDQARADLSEGMTLWSALAPGGGSGDGRRRAATRGGLRQGLPVPRGPAPSARDEPIRRRAQPPAARESPGPAGQCPRPRRTDQRSRHGDPGPAGGDVGRLRRNPDPRQP
jgi:ATP-binding cassette subfamily F protein uup